MSSSLFHGEGRFLAASHRGKVNLGLFIEFFGDYSPLIGSHLKSSDFSNLLDAQIDINILI